ncbi:MULTISPECIES: DUF1440 domain-containing protein [Micromonospora]|uniref:DUF1440 domain-containing protein n=1 Tax=Micromonospora echinofusca TaxID=47858 RepID=A0A1C5G6X1_MICEH|nr:DUF1440 domain-containing protein [Micromonospora echinofusca]SCG15624.1 hypothetical protein GA0070610_1861 [Micromonospora echinofusca]
MRLTETIKDLAVAPAAGYAATKVMDPISMTLYQLESDADRKREDAARPGLPYEIAVAMTLRLLGVDLHGTARQRAGMAFHYGLAISWAPVYTLLRRTTRLNPVLAGLASGAAMSLIVDEGITPALRFSAPTGSTPIATHLRGFVAHLAYGLALAAVTETAWALTRRRP